MFAKPQAEHDFFRAFVGEFDYEHVCNVGPDQPPQVSKGRLIGRSLGGLWTLLEATGQTPDGDPFTSLFTLGYDPKKQIYHGTFIASMMTHLWLYQGQLDETKKVLTLNVEGPSFDDSGSVKYQDIFEVVDEDNWVLRSKMQMKDGAWCEFMVGQHTRVR